jgi:hypothetical protein
MELHMVEAIQNQLDRSAAAELRLIDRQIRKLAERRSELLINAEHRFVRHESSQPDEADGFDRLISSME